MSNFSQKGNPLDDKRLSLAYTTKSGAQQYRIWRDSQQILVPKGQSTTKPLQTENVQANTGVHGSIKKGYFNTPILEIRNTTNFDLFDRLYMMTSREELPEYPDIDPNDILGLKKMRMKIDIEFNASDFKGIFNELIEIKLLKDRNWESETLHFEDYNLNHICGRFKILTEPTEEQLKTGLVFNTGKKILTGDLDLYVIVSESHIYNGNTKMPLLQHNNEKYLLKLVKFEHEMKGGY